MSTSFPYRLGMFSRTLTYAVSILALWLAVGSAAVHAAPAVCKPETGEIKFTYVNGVWNDTPAAAFDSAEHLQNAWNERPGSSPIRVATFWNPGDGKFADVLEALIYQNWGAAPTLFGAALGIWETAIASPPTAAAIAGEIAGAAARFRIEIDLFKARLKDDIDNGRKNVIVAHSQGNLLVNIALRELQKEGVSIDTIAVVNVASPDTSTASTYNFSITNADDEIIKNIPNHAGNIFQQVGPDELATWTGKEIRFPEPSRHAFVESYLSPYIKDGMGVSLQDRILDGMDAMRRAVDSCGTVGSSQPDPDVQIQIQSKVVDLSKEHDANGNPLGYATCGDNTWYDQVTQKYVPYSECHRPWAALTKATCTGSGCSNVLVIIDQIACRNQEGPETSFPGQFAPNAPEYTQISQAYYQQWVVTGGTPPPDYPPRFKTYTLTCEMDLLVKYFNGPNAPKTMPLGRFAVSGGF